MTDAAASAPGSAPGSADDAAASFEPHRRFLVGLAYRMLGSVAEAEDVAQDAFLRWNATDRARVAEPRAFLARTASRLCLDRMKAASTRREHYVGTWLPEPLVDPLVEPAANAAIGVSGPGASHATAAPDALALAEDVSVALLVTLERLSPLERAAFLLHDVFDMDYRDVAEVLDRSEAACRQLAARGRDHVRDQRPRYEATPAAVTRLAGAFHTAMFRGDLAGLARLLAEDAVLYSDGGGKRNAALNPIYGRDKILRFIAGLADKGWLPDPMRAEPARINGLPGFVITTAEGRETLALEVSGEAIVAIYGVRNPDKLGHLGAR
ncbi:MAG TPA: sigma-70 family RNA polymerase sigma factor [Kofleriaceae bacterium]|jgi:RNA polymerase sigma-70 factor (ECF subfamily)